MSKHNFIQRLIPSKAMIAAIIAVSLIGVSPIFIRLVTIGPNAMGFYRMFFSMGFLLIWSAVTSKHRSYERLTFGRPLVLIFLSGLFFSLDLACWHASLLHTEIVNASLFSNLIPVFMPLLVWVVYSQKPSWRFMIAVLIAILGASMVVGESINVNFGYLKGELLALGTSFFYSCYLLVVSKLRKFMPVAKVMAWTSLFCALFMLLYAVLANEKIMLTTSNDWIGVLCLALLVQTGGQAMLAYAMGHISENIISMIVLLSTVVSGIIGWVVFGEALSLIQFIGGLIVIAAIIYAKYVETSTQKRYTHVASDQ